MWLDNHKNSKLALSAQELEEVDLDETDHLMGLFAEDAIQWHHKRTEGIDPSLAQMTEKAVLVSQKV